MSLKFENLGKFKAKIKTISGDWLETLLGWFGDIRSDLKCLAANCL
jgi:hypothetical protein